MAYYEPGRYRCTIVNQGFGNSKQKGTPYFYLTVKPMERVISSESIEPCVESYERDIILYLTDKTISNVIPKLRALGWEGSDWSELDPMTGDYHSFAHQGVTASCEIEQVDDKMYEKWNLSGGKGMDHTREDNVVRTLNAMFGKALKGGNSSKPKVKPPTKREAIPVTDDSEQEQDPIPF